MTHLRVARNRSNRSAYTYESFVGNYEDDIESQQLVLESTAESTADATVLSAEPQVPRPTRAVPGENQMAQSNVIPMQTDSDNEDGVQEDLEHIYDEAAREVFELINFGNNAAWEKISALLYRDVIPQEDEYIDITEETIIPWRLWVSNLGNRTSEIIGEGIKAVHLSRTQEHEVRFNFIRVDNTQASLLLGCRERFDASEVYTRSR